MQCRKYIIIFYHTCQGCTLAAFSFSLVALVLSHLRFLMHMDDLMILRCPD